MKMVELGGNISLEGFGEVDKGAMVIVKKIVGNYGRKFTEDCDRFENLRVAIENYDSSTTINNYHIAVELKNKGSVINKAIKDRNLFIALDSALKEIEKDI